MVVAMGACYICLGNGGNPFCHADAHAVRLSWGR